MNTNVQIPSAREKAPRYTGFNEPFSHDRNTTLAHPDADTSPNACIEGLDYNLTRTHSKNSFRHAKSHASHSFRHPLNRNKHSVGATSIGSDLSTMYDNMQLADGSAETKGKRDEEAGSEVVRESKGTPGLIPGLMGGQKRRERLPNDSGVDMGMDTTERESIDEYRTEKKKGFLGKLGL